MPAPLQTIEKLASLGPRWPGKEGDRIAVEHLADELREQGREAELEEIRVRPAYHITHALHAALAVVGSVVSVYVPLLGVVILLLVVVSAYGDFTASFHLLRRLTPRRTTWNVHSPGSDPGAAAHVVLTAHHDAARTGLLYALRVPQRLPRLLRWLPRLARWLARLASPIDLTFWATSASLALAATRMLTGSESIVLTAIQFVPTVYLVLAAGLLLDVGLSRVSPGASANASGTAAVLEVSRRLADDPPRNLDVQTLFPAASECFMLGMREWLRTHEPELDHERTFFVNVDTVGHGSVRCVEAEGFVLLYRHDPRLVGLCESFGAEPYAWRTGTNGYLPIRRGFASVTVCCADDKGHMPNRNSLSDTPDNVDRNAVAAATDVVERLVRRIGAEFVPATGELTTPAPRG